MEDAYRQLISLPRGDPAVLRPVLGVDAAYLDIALDEMRGRFGSIDRYFADGLGSAPTCSPALRVALVEP
jgi:protein-tyrosine phosphatase